MPEIVQEQKDASGSVSRDSEAALKAEMLCRVQDTFQATLASPGIYQRNRGRLDDRLRKVAESAAFYYRSPSVPNWPPHMLVRKILRAILRPFLWPIAEFQLAVNEALREMHKQIEGHNYEQSEAIADLEHRVETLQAELTSLTIFVSKLSPSQVAGHSTGNDGISFEANDS